MALLFCGSGVAGFAGWCGVGGWGFRLGFRCAGIRNSKCPCGRLWKADASTPDEPSVARPGFVLPSVAAHRCVLAGALRFSNFLPKSQNESRLDAICQPQGCEPPFAGELILQPWGCVNFCDIHFKKVEKSRHNLLYLCF